MYYLNVLMIIMYLPSIHLLTLSALYCCSALQLTCACSADTLFSLIIPELNLGIKIIRVGLFPLRDNG